jgi:predicted MFS family arabinose efflux permease
LDLANPVLLLAFTFALGLGSTINAPVWQAVIPELIPREELPGAVALGGIGINLARAIGPALAGFLVVLSGPAAVFLLNALSFALVMVVLYRWRRETQVSALPAEHVFGAMRAGIRYVQHAPALQAVLVRTGTLMICGSALWALLPGLSRQNLKLSASEYGILLACVGVAAVCGATILPKIRQRLTLDSLMVCATGLFALVTFSLSVLHNFFLLCGVMFLAGIAWMAIMSSLNVSAQLSVPKWVQARALGMYQLVFQGGLAAGSIIWGVVANYVGIPMALVGAAIGLILGLATAFRYRLHKNDKQDLTSSMHWAEPAIAIAAKPDDGPVVVQLTYQIHPNEAVEFVQAMQALKEIRLRDGAIRWELVQALDDATHYVESFLVESLGEHERQHHRVTIADREIEKRAKSFHIGKEPLNATHYLYIHQVGPKPPAGQISG